MKKQYIRFIVCLVVICSLLSMQSFASEKITYNTPVITGNSVRLSARAMNSQRLYSTEAGCYLGRTQENMSLIGKDALGFVSNYVDSWFEVNGLENGKYYYRFYCIIGGETRWGEVSSFVIGSESNVTVSYSNIKVDITGTKAVIQGRASKTGDSFITGCGITVGTSPNDLKYRANDSGFSHKNYVDLSYDTQTELNMNLVPGTTYYYQLHVVIDGKIHDDIVRNFTVPSTNHISGQEIVNTARKYIGLPYRWGGTDLNSGVDCSGYICSIFSLYGIELWGNRTSLQNAGTIISKEAALPGDLIHYRGHIGIYTGNNKMISALTNGVQEINIYQLLDENGNPNPPDSFIRIPGVN